MNLKSIPRVWLYAALGITVLVGGYFLWQRVHPPNLVTPMSQAQAETSGGISVAAHNAKVSMLHAQLDAAARQIAELKNRPPEYIVKTVPVEVEKVIEVERKKSGGDFAIVTDPVKSDEPVDLTKIKKLDTSTTISLNQYNVHAYKSVLRSVDITPNWSSLTQGKFKIDEAGFGIARKISRDGKYIGLRGSYNFEHKESKLTIQYIF